MENWKGLVAVVTGASAGIGKAIAIRLAQEGMKVAALARRMDRLQELSKSINGIGEIRGYKCDISKDKEVEETFKKIEQEMGQVRVLVNNAGLIIQGKVTDFNLDKWRQVFDVNFFGLFSCTKQVMSSAEKNKESGLVHIININSLVGHWEPHLPADFVMVPIYQCSKRSLLLMTRALYREIAKDKKNIKITSISPGVVATEIGEAAGLDLSAINTDSSSLKSEEIADAVIIQLSAPKNVLMSDIIIQPVGEAL